MNESRSMKVWKGEREGEGGIFEISETIDIQTVYVDLENNYGRLEIILNVHFTPEFNRLGIRAA